MSISLVITNTTSAKVPLLDLYTELGASGTSTAALTITRSVAQIDNMPNLKALVNAGTVTVALTASADNYDILSLPIEQHGVVANMVVNTATVVTSAVTFANAFHVAPVVTVSAVQTASSTAWKGQAYAQAVTTTGFTAALDVTTGVAGTHTAEAVVLSPLANGVLLGPFTTTLAHVPVTAAAITVNWLESTVAKVATITGNVASALLNRTTGALSITFATAHAPDTGSVTIDYVQVISASVAWVATY